MRVLFINPETKDNARNSGIPLGLIAIASYLIPLGHTVKIVDRTKERIDVYKKAIDFQPDIIGISVVGQKSAPDAEKLSKKLKKCGYTVAWGGPFAACVPEMLLNNGLADYVFMGEGELAWAELLEALESKDEEKIKAVDGIYSRINEELHYNGMHSLGDLNTFPPMDFSVVNPSDFFQESFDCKKMLHICSAKGCPNHCTFCYNPPFNLSVYRKRPLEQVFSEITLLHHTYGMDGIYFTDELWANTRDELQEFCHEFLKRKLDIRWGCQTTAGRFTKEDYQLMYDSGCRWLFFGIESGSQRVLAKVGKKLDYEQVKQSVAHCREVGIATICAFVVGFPEETEEDLKLTVQLAKELPAAYYSINFYAPLPGSAMCTKLIREGKYKNPTTVKEVVNGGGIETVFKGICDIRPLDLYVVQCSFMFKSLIGSGMKEVDKASRVRFFIKVVREALSSMLKHGIVNFFSQFYYNATMVIRILFYAFCFPHITKKYGIK